MTWYEDFLKKFFHDPIDKPFDIPNHEERARIYAEFFGVSVIEKGKYSDIIASCMERSLLPKEKIFQDFTEVRHPLSREKLDISLDKEKAKKEIYETIEEISKSYVSQKDEKKALSIWRNFLEEILSRLQDIELIELKDIELKKFIPILPADTRVPDHSIWEHLKVTTAINAFENYQNNCLFLFTIGPVQSFISQARKSQDFYMGSFILSYLTFIAIQKVIEEFGPTSIIYPDLYKQPLMDWYLVKIKKLQHKNFKSETLTIPTIPNRFVAIIGITDKNDIKERAKKMREKIEDEMNNAKEKILKELEIKIDSTQEDILKNQLSDFPQIYWVAIPWRKGDYDLKIDDLQDFFNNEKLEHWKKLSKFAKEKGEYPPNIGFLYQLIYTALEKSMGARKNLRKFEQRKEEGRKCSLCGERNVLFFWESKNKHKFIKYNPKAYDLTCKVEKKYLAEGEGLCGICFIKRTFEIYLKNVVDKIFENFSFPSTAEVACSDFKEMAKNLAKSEFNKYEETFFQYIPIGYLKIKSLPKLKLEKTLEGSWFYEENLKEKKFKDELGIEISTEKIKELKQLLEKINKKVGKPNPYYAVIYLDGDNMGKWLSGELLPEIEYAYNSKVWENLAKEFKEGLAQLTQRKILTPAIHSAISTALRNYAIEFVRKIVEEEHLGKLIYAGGDDVLAFVNLRDLFDVMEKLRWTFSGHIKIENGTINVEINNDSGFVLKDGVYYLTMGKNATCSMGIIIAHYKEPLKIVIDKAFELNKEAKNKGKNKFAICLMKHSGEERVGFAEWAIDSYLTTKILKKLKNWMNRENEDKKYISDGFIQKFRAEFYKLKEASLPERLVETELKRLINRAYNGAKEERKDFVDKFFDEAKKLLWGTGGDIVNFNNLIEIASFMNRGE